MRRACKVCKMVMDENACPRCKATTTSSWSGYLGITNTEISKIAKRMEIKLPGEYALKVR